MEVQEIKGKDNPKTDKDLLRESMKGKQTISAQDKDSLLLQMAKDFGYLK
jgi:hypothetical protein